jgi:membrane protein DedA with SNARE-associated domain
MTAPDVVQAFLHLGLVGMVAIGAVEKFAPVVPSYVILMLLGMTVSDGPHLALTILATACGSLIGSSIWYSIGRGLGDQRVEGAVERFGRYVFFSPSTYQRLAGAYRRNHFWATLIGQTVPVARIYLALPAGVFRLRPGSFVAAAAIGILLWNAPFLALGYLLKGSGHDPFDVGFWMSLVLVGMEATLVYCVRLFHRASI